jgi:hypothetical protein
VGVMQSDPAAAPFFDPGFESRLGFRRPAIRNKVQLQHEPVRRQECRGDRPGIGDEVHLETGFVTRTFSNHGLAALVNSM